VRTRTKALGFTLCKHKKRS